MRKVSPSSINERRSEAIASLDAFFNKKATGCRLSERTIERYKKRGFRIGWSLSVIGFSDDIHREFRVLVDGGFPYTAPRIVLADAPHLLDWPHLEKDGYLCILPNDASISVDKPVAVVEYLLSEACQLIQECIRGNNKDDFQKEFLSYWYLAVDRGTPNIISLIEPLEANRKIKVWRGNSLLVVGEDQNTLVRWLSRRRYKSRQKSSYRLYDGVLIWLQEPLLPHDFPSNASDVWKLAREKSHGGSAVLEKTVESGTIEINVLLGATTSNGACFGAVTIRPPKVASRSKGRKNLLEAGFRPGHTPKHLLTHRFLSSTAEISKHVAKRADHRWIHGRDQDSTQKLLRERRIAVLGCGSLGGPISRLLAQAGIGNLLLIDPGNMDWPNISRHVLGASSVDSSKSKELAREISASYPHLGEVSGRQIRFGPEEDTIIEQMASYDLIVSTTGDWAAESFLNDLQRERPEYPAVIYGWVEANAAAAHSVHIPQGDACLRCGVNEMGRPILNVIDWPDGRETQQEPACGATYTPYGPVELCWAHALISETVIDALTNDGLAAVHRTWIGSRSRVTLAGGTWSETWVGENGDPGSGELKIERPWRASSNCPVCGRS